MKFSIVFLVVFSSYCYCERLLGGWSVSKDELMKKELLKKALFHIRSGNVGDGIESKVSDFDCRVQIVNGLNIKCSFTLNEKTWDCSFYKSFVETLGTTLEKCQSRSIGEVSDDNNNEKIIEEYEKEQQFEELKVSKDDENEEKQVAAKDDEDEEKKIAPKDDNDEEEPEVKNDDNEEEKTTTENLNENEQQSTAFAEENDEIELENSDENENEQKSKTSFEEEDDELQLGNAILNENEEKSATSNDNHDGEQPQAVNTDETDDEAEIDALYKKISQADANADEQDDE